MRSSPLVLFMARDRSGSLPLRADLHRRTARIAASRERVGPSLERPSNRRPVVLCVDDDAFYLTSLARLLGREGYSVAVYDDPERALEAVPELEPDLAIVDVLMPGMSGLDLAAELHARPRPVPVMVLSAVGTDEAILRAHRRGVRSYLTKPCDPRTLVRAVADLARSPEP